MGTWSIIHIINQSIICAKINIMTVRHEGCPKVLHAGTHKNKRNLSISILFNKKNFAEHGRTTYGTIEPLSIYI